MEALDGDVFVCVDDWQWMDAATRDALGRLRVPALFAGHAAGPDAVEELRVSPLGEEAARLLPADLPLLVRERILREAAGFPLALIELPLAYAGADDGTLLGSWAPLTPALEAAFGPDEADAGTAIARLVAALDDGDDLGAVQAAAERLAGRPLDVDPARLTFAHPLTRAAVRHAAAPELRRAGHEAFAAVIEATDPDRATWHRVVAASGLDPALADAIEAVAYRAREAGDYERAAAALRRAAHLTPPNPLRSRRFASAAGLAHEIGGVEVADRLAQEVVPEELDLVGQARIAAMRRRPAETLIALAEQVDDRRLTLKLLWLAATELQALGHGPVVVDVPGTRLATSADLPAQDPVTPGEQALLGYAALVLGHVHRSAALLTRAAEGLRAQRRRTARGEVLALAAWAQLAISAFDDAHASAAEAAWLAERTRAPLWGALAQAAMAIIAAVRGDEEQAERRAADAEHAAVPAHASVVLALVQHARGMSALAAGRPAEAFAHLRRTFDPADPAHDGEAASVLLGDLAEAATDADERALVRRLAAISPSSPRVTAAVAHATLVLAEDDDADAAFASAYAQIGERWPFTRARVLLVHGMRLRRERRMADSRAPLREAAVAFAALGCTPWAERAQNELAATVETASRDGQERLTPRELEIARMAARGLTNRAIAADLALSPRTVGHHLARIFPKLDVGSRAGVGAALERHGY